LLRIWGIFLAVGVQYGSFCGDKALLSVAHEKIYAGRVSGCHTRDFVAGEQVREGSQKVRSGHFAAHVVEKQGSRVADFAGVVEERKGQVMRDRRFVAAHRGGPLDLERHRLLANWAAACAEHVLPLFEGSVSDERPRLAIATSRAWAQGEVRVGAAQKAARAAHAAAREAKLPAAVAAARSAGHAAATAHCADHSLAAAHYARKAAGAASPPLPGELAWQLAQLPEPVRELIRSKYREMRLLE